MNEIQNIETKVENGGTTPQGRVSAAEFNIITDAAKRFDVSKYGAARISEGGQLQFFADAASMVSYEADPQTNAALLLKSLSLPTSNIDISGKLDKAEFYRYFEEVNIGTAEAPVYATRSKRGLFSDSFLSSLGLNPGMGGGGDGSGTTYNRLDLWGDYTAERAGWVLSAALGYELHNRVSSLESNIVPDLSEYATRVWVQQQGYATSAALAAHAGDVAIHISSAERTLWNKTAADFAAIVGADSDDIINKWEEVVAFLDTYTEADTLANLLSNKVDKVTGYGLSKNDFTDALLSKLNGIDAGANRYIHPTGGADAAIDDAAGRVLAGITVNALGHVTSVSSKTLAAADIPTLSISKVSGLQDALDGKLDAATFDDLFEKVNIGTTSAPKYAIRAKYGLYADGFLSSLGLNPSGGGGTGGGSYDRLDLWGDYTSERAGWVLSAGLGYELHNRVSSLEGGSALSFTTEGTGNVVTVVKKSGTAVVVTKGLTALTSHQPIYALNFQAGAFEAKKYTPNTGAQTVNIPTKTSHLSNDSGFITTAALTGYATQSWVQGLGYITASALTPYITEATANATFATKLGISGNQIGTYVNGKLGNLITVPYATNAASLATARTLWGQSFDGSGNVSGNMTGVGSISASGEIITTSPNAFRMIYGSYGSFFRQDETSLWLMLTDKDDVYGTFNSLRPFYVELANGNVHIGSELVVKKRVYFGDSAHYIELDENGNFHFSHGVYSDTFLSSLGLNSSGGGGTGGGSYDRLDAWSDYTADKAGWVLSAALGYDLYSRVSSLEGGSAMSFTTEGTGNVVTAVKKSGTAVVVTKGLTALTSHQPIYALNFQAGAFEAKKYTPNTGAQTVNIPTKTSHLSNDSGFITTAALTGYATQSWVQGLGYITASALTPYITEATANATFATKLGISGNQIGTYVNGKLGNLITVPYATNAASLATARTLWGQSFDGSGNVSGNMTGVGSISASGEISTSSPNAFRMTYGNYGAFFRQDGQALYLMLTDSGNQTGTFNAFRPFLVELATGTVKICGTSGLTVLTGGNVGIGTSNPAYKLDVNGTTRINANLYLCSHGQSYFGLGTGDGATWATYNVKLHLHYGMAIADDADNINFLIDARLGNFSAKGTVSATKGIWSDGYMSAKGINTASDVRLKRRIADVALTVRDVAEAPVYRFAWINGGGIDVGSTAQYWAARVPELTHLLSDGIHLGLDYGKAALLSVVAVARSTADHERRIASLERQLLTQNAI